MAPAVIRKIIVKWSELLKYEMMSYLGQLLNWAVDLGADTAAFVVVGLAMVQSGALVDREDDSCAFLALDSCSLPAAVTHAEAAGKKWKTMKFGRIFW